MADRWDEERYRDRGRGPRYRGEGPYGDWGRGRGEYGREYGEGGRGEWRGGDREDRGFFERAGDEIRSWFGDDEAQGRRSREEGEYGRAGYGGGYGWPGTRGYGERYSGGERGGHGRRRDERDWARQWGWMDEREAREAPELRRWNRQEGAETRGPVDYWRSGRGGEPGWGEGGYPEGSRRGESSYGEGGRGDDWGTGGGTWRYSETWVVLGPFAGRGPRNYQRSDERIREEVCERMAQHGRLDPSGLEVRVQDGEVTLSGSVSDRRAKRLAEDIADSVSGVREVHNQLRVSTEQGQAPQPGGTQGWPPGGEGQRAA